MILPARIGNEKEKAPPIVDEKKKTKTTPHRRYIKLFHFDFCTTDKPSEKNDNNPLGMHVLQNARRSFGLDSLTVRRNVLYFSLSLCDNIHPNKSRRFEKRRKLYIRMYPMLKIDRVLGQDAHKL
jgi:hypothetical protein